MKMLQETKQIEVAVAKLEDLNSGDIFLPVAKIGGVLIMDRNLCLSTGTTQDDKVLVVSLLSGEIKDYYKSTLVFPVNTIGYHSYGF